MTLDAASSRHLTALAAPTLLLPTPLLQKRIMLEMRAQQGVVLPGMGFGEVSSCNPHQTAFSKR